MSILPFQEMSLVCKVKFTTRVKTFTHISTLEKPICEKLLKLLYLNLPPLHLSWHFISKTSELIEIPITVRTRDKVTKRYKVNLERTIYLQSAKQTWTWPIRKHRILTETNSYVYMIEGASTNLYCRKFKLFSVHHEGAWRAKYQSKKLLQRNQIF